MKTNVIRIRNSEDRGHRNRGWLDARFTFSFADYDDPSHRGFRVLRVLNEDVIEPGRGFGPHAHRDMEIVTYVLDGALRHRDSMGEEHTLGRGEVQAMSAGTGIVHSEFNASETETVHSMQIWIEPWAEDLQPSYQQIAVDPQEKRGRLCLIAGPAGEEDSAATHINQNARVYACELAGGDEVEAKFPEGRYAWVQVVRGQVRLDAHSLEAGDGAAVDHPEILGFRGITPSEFLLFDLP